MAQGKALVSIHDCMPETWAKIEPIIDRLQELRIPPVTLLVVPGKEWKREQVDRLRELGESGYELAAHGWVHTTRPRKLYHRIHSLLISRDVAEHLDLDSKGIADLLNRSREWFLANDLPDPGIYVPPAWALGSIKADDLLAVPYRLIETTRGVLVREGAGKSFQFTKLPLTGFEADTWFREFFLRRWNRNQCRRARRKGVPLRISIHPFDPELRVADQMEELLKMPWQFLRYGDLGGRLIHVIG